MNDMSWLELNFVLSVLFSDLPPSQGGRYTGFGSSSVNPNDTKQSSGKLTQYTWLKCFVATSPTFGHVHFDAGLEIQPFPPLFCWDATLIEITLPIPKLIHRQLYNFSKLSQTSLFLIPSWAKT